MIKRLTKNMPQFLFGIGAGTIIGTYNSIRSGNPYIIYVCGIAVILISEVFIIKNSFDSKGE